MARTKFKETSIVDKIEILCDDTIQVRTRNQVLKNDVEIASSFQRHVLIKGDDLSGQDLRVQKVAAAIWNI